MQSFVVDFTTDVNPDGTIPLHNQGKKPLVLGDVVKLSDEVGNTVEASVTRTLESIAWVKPDPATRKDAIFA